MPDRAGRSPPPAAGAAAGFGRVLLGEQATGVIAGRAGHVAVDVHAARHHDHAAGVERRGAGRHVRYDPAVVDADVPHLAVDPVGGIVDRAPDDAQPAHRAAREAVREAAHQVTHQRLRRARARKRRLQRQRDVVHPVADAGFVDPGDAGIDGHVRGKWRAARPGADHDRRDALQTRSELVGQALRRADHQHGRGHRRPRDCRLAGAAGTGAPRGRNPPRRGSRSATCSPLRRRSGCRRPAAY